MVECGVWSVTCLVMVCCVVCDVHHVQSLQCSAVQCNARGCRHRVVSELVLVVRYPTGIRTTFSFVSVKRLLAGILCGSVLLLM